MTSVPVTDAFDDSETMEPLDIEMTPAQIEWLEQTAAERGVSVGHVLRTIVTAQMRAAEDDASASATHAGDGRPPSFSDEEGTDASARPSDDEDNLLDRLRAVNEQLPDRATDQSDDGREEDETAEAASLFPVIDDSSNASDATSTQRRSDPTPHEDGERSMFDMVEDG